MNCKRCGQRLWGVRSRECPGCAAPFKPSEFRFARKAVRFCCPRCEQGYLGAGHDGLPEPHKFECVACGRWIHIDQMYLEIAEGVEEEDTRADANPWLEMHRPLWMRWCLAAARGVFTPRELLQLTPRDLEPRSAAAFLLVAHAVFLLGGLAAAPGLGLCLSLPAGGRAFGVLTPRGLLVLGALLAGSLAFAGLWPLALHALLRRRAPDARPERTLHAVWFTCAPQGLWFLPGVGLYAGWLGTLLWAVGATRALAEAHRVPARRAAPAVAALPCACALALGIGLAAAGLRARGGPGALQATTGTEAVAAFAAPLRGAAVQGRPVNHAAELMADGRLPPASLLAPGSLTSGADVELAGVTLADFEQASPARRLAIIQQAAHALPAGALAHRLGDFVFVLDAIASAGAHPGLWVVIEAWDPGLNPSARQAIRVLLADGSSRTIPAGLRPHALIDQNRLRAGAGLPRLPPPHEIRADEPAVVTGG